MQGTPHMAKDDFHIVVLDGYTLVADDLNWDGLQALGRCTIYDRTPEIEIVSRSIDADAVLINKVPLSADAIAQLPKLKYIGVTATGTNIVDLAVARERNIIVTNVPGYGTQSVAQMVFSHLLNLAQRVGNHAALVRAGRWASSPDWCFWDTPQIELAGLTMGILGFGAIGREVGKIADAFGMNVIANNRSQVEHPDYVRMVDVDTLFRTADVVSLHCPLTPETRKIVNHERLTTMKPSAYLINTGRGQLVDEQALANALASKEIAGAGLDVLSQEPPPADHPLVNAPNCFISPHIAWATKSARTRLLEAVVDNLAAFLAGKSKNVVNGA
jgi:glycerate dehydrogenase